MFKQIAVAVGAAVTFGSSIAADQTVSFTGTLAQFGSGFADVLDGGSDAIAFDNLAAGRYDFDLSLSSQHVDLTSVSLNGIAGTLLPMGTFHFAGVHGTANTPVPEPETYSLMLAGLAAMGFIARRRRPADMA